MHSEVSLRNFWLGKLLVAWGREDSSGMHATFDTRLACVSKSKHLAICKVGLRATYQSLRLTSPQREVGMHYRTLTLHLSCGPRMCMFSPCTRTLSVKPSTL